MDINQWGTALTTSAAAALSVFFLAIPRLIGFVVILLIGWLISGLLAAGVTALLRAVHFNLLAQRSGFHGFLLNMGLRTDSSSFVANTVKWFVRLIVLVVAFDALGLPAVSVVLQQFLLWIPNLVAAVVILIIAGLAANALGDLVRGSTAQAEFENPDLLATITRVAVWSFGIVVAVNQVGIGQELVNTLFVGLTSALALAAGFAFGLGGRDVAARIVQGWYRRRDVNGPGDGSSIEGTERAMRVHQQPPH
ncbi:MAG TPA: hypothetical protein VK900_02395 [Anaerolineales bacterium]|nr:hypothetical protein [Anaerolineales bacterium]